MKILFFIEQHPNIGHPKESCERNKFFSNVNWLHILKKYATIHKGLEDRDLE